MTRSGDQMRSSGIAGLFVTVCSMIIAVLVVVIAAMVIAAVAFSSGITIGVPLVATFVGSRTEVGSPAVTVTGSWIGAGVSMLVLAVPFPLWFVVSRRCQVVAI
jgi:hypothetical protein